MEAIFNLDYSGVASLLWRCAAFISAGLLLAYLFFLLFSKILYRRRRHHRDHVLRLCRCWSLVLLLGCVSIYLVSLIKHYGFANISWMKWDTLMGLTPLFCLYLCCVVLFLLDYYDYRKRVKDTKII